MNPAYKIGEVVRVADSVEEGTVTGVADDTYYVKWNNNPQNNKYYTADELIMVRGAVAPGSNPVVDLSSIGNGAIGVSPIKTK